VELGGQLREDTEVPSLLEDVVDLGQDRGGTPGSASVMWQRVISRSAWTDTTGRA
jgi:Tfp pilus assembly protein PilO